MHIYEKGKGSRNGKKSPVVRWYNRMLSSTNDCTAGTPWAPPRPHLLGAGPLGAVCTEEKLFPGSPHLPVERINE